MCDDLLFNCTLHDQLLFRIQANHEFSVNQITDSKKCVFRLSVSRVELAVIEKTMGFGLLMTISGKKIRINLARW